MEITEGRLMRAKREMEQGKDREGGQAEHNPAIVAATMDMIAVKGQDTTPTGQNKGANTEIRPLAGTH